MDDFPEKNYLLRETIQSDRVPTKKIYKTFRFVCLLNISNLKLRLNLEESFDQIICFFVWRQDNGRLRRYCGTFVMTRTESP